MNKPTTAHTHARPAPTRPAQGRPAQQRNVQEQVASQAGSLNRQPSGHAGHALDVSMEAPALPARAAYCPELGEQPPARLFHSEYNHAGTYSVCWKVEDDHVARMRLRELRIFPKRVEFRSPAEWLQAQRLGVDVYACLITSKAHGKLQDATLVAIRTLLD